MTIFEQTGWKRSHPQQICQEIDVLERVSVFTFDPFNEDFLDYVKSRTGGDWRKATGGQQKFKELLADETYQGPGRFFHYIRAKHQDCWELYRAELKERAA